MAFNKNQARDSLGRFRSRGRARTKARQGTRGLGARGQSGRATSALSAGGTIAGVDANKAASKNYKEAAVEITTGVKVKKGR
jgi:hypothetical protein